MSPKEAERRQSPRLRIAVDVGISSEHNFYSAKTRDISAGGLFIETDVGLAIGARILVELHLLQTKTLIPAEVVWILLGEDGRSEGVGVQFLQLSKQVRERIESFMGLRSAMRVGEAGEEPPPLPGRKGGKGPPPFPG